MLFIENDNLKGNVLNITFFVYIIENDNHKLVKLLKNNIKRNGKRRSIK